DSRAMAIPPAPEPVVDEVPAPASVSAAVEEPPARAGRPAAQPQPVATASSPAMDEAGSAFAAIDGGRAVVLVDANGLLLAGSLTTPEGVENGDRVAAELAGVSREASRAGRLLGLGQWHSITLECPDAHCVLVQPTTDTVLLAAREPSLPIARVVLVAERAAREAKTWLERVQ
ncbi:MAG TPA: roadblock/LC7 domain-containing protein, partial [Gemmatimonadales bacterium]|nr:roadblock/LC7 domain-containing protein [Gemmatimonadales bacterium]